MRGLTTVQSCVSALLLLLPTAALAQELPDTARAAVAAAPRAAEGTRIWASLALGGGAWQGMRDHAALGALAYSIQATGQRGAGLLTARVSGAATPLAGGVWDAGLLYGRAAERGAMHYSVSAGVAYVRWWEDAFLFEEEEERGTVGLPLAAEAVWVPTRWLGLGAELYGNLNDVSSFFGLGAVLRVGNLRAPAPPQVARLDLPAPR